MSKILVLSSAESSYTVDSNRVFTQQIEEQLPQTTVDTCHYRDVSLFITTGKIVARRISTGVELNDYDLVYFKSFYRYTEVAAAVANYLQQEGVKYLCQEIDQSISFSKLTQYSRLARCDLPIIPTVFVEKAAWADGVRLIESSFGFPCVFKAIDAKGGDVNFLVLNSAELIAATKQHNCDFVAQQFIDNDYDLRVLIANNKVECVIKRQRLDNKTHLNNTSKGASSQLLEPENLDSAILDIARRAAAEFRREIAGVDIMINKATGVPVILEVNASPQVATGAFTDEKIAVYAEAFRSILQIPDIDKN